MPSQANIVLTGFMGTGKSVVGQLVAELTERAFIDTDALIEERHGPIPTIFEDHGEPHFRGLEREIVRELVDRGGLVIATGGGTFVDEPSSMMLESAGSAVYTLTAAPAEIVRRVIADGISDRPLLSADDPAERVTALLGEREHVYGRFTQVRTDGRRPEEVAAEIANDARNRGVVSLEPGPTRASKMSGLAVVIILSIIAVIAIGIGVTTLARASSEGGPLDNRRVNVLGALPDGAPAGDEYFEVDAVLDTDTDAVAVLRDHVEDSGVRVVDDTAIRIATVDSQFGEKSMYVWEQLSAVPGEVAELSTCTGLVGSGASTWNCGGDESTSVRPGGFTDSAVRSSLVLDFASDSARWMVVETNRGRVVVSDVVQVEVLGGFSYAEWSAVDGAASRVTLLNEDLVEVWSETVAIAS